MLKFFLLMQLDERVLSSSYFVKNALSLCVRFATFNTSITLAPSYVQSDGNLLSAKIEESIVLVHHATIIFEYHYIRNALCGDRQINDLRVFPIRYISAALSAQICIYCTLCVPLLLLYAPAIMLHLRG